MSDRFVDGDKLVEIRIILVGGYCRMWGVNNKFLFEDVKMW